MRTCNIADQIFVVLGIARVIPLGRRGAWLGGGLRRRPCWSGWHCWGGLRRPSQSTPSTQGGCCTRPPLQGWACLDGGPRVLTSHQPVHLIDAHVDFQSPAWCNSLTRLCAWWGQPSVTTLSPPLVASTRGWYSLTWTPTIHNMPIRFGHG